MTLGQRIQELRKQHGMSQESLGDALGVSRQAVSKWEGDNGIPELDTLIAMSRLFEVTVGQLLGVEEAFEPKDETSNDKDDVESVLRRYAEQTTKDQRSWFERWGNTVSQAIIVTTVFIVMFAQLTSLRSTVRLLQHDLSNLQVDVSNMQGNLSSQIRDTIYDVLAEEANLLSTFQWEIVNFDLDQQTATIRLDATMKEYAAGSKLQFCAAWKKVDQTEGQTIGGWVDGPNFRSEITLPFNYNTVISIRVEDADGNIKEQVLQEPIYGLHPDNFHLYAHNLTTPFAVTFKKSFAEQSLTAQGEQEHVIIESIHPDFIWPEKAEIAAYLNDTEIMREDMIISPSERTPQVFTASIQDTYYDLTLKDGDMLKIELIVTDNFGRTEQFFDSIGVINGELEMSPAAAPVVPTTPY